MGPRSILGSIIERLKHLVFVRHGHNWLLLLRFGLVGGSGVLVNLATLIVVKKIFGNEQGVFVGLPLTSFNIRWYHVFSTMAFLVANVWNFQLNRRYTFKSTKHSGWWREYLPFFSVGLLGQIISLAILTLLMHPDSVFALSPRIFDDSSGLRTRLYWAQLITVVIVTPLSFVLNKIWTFSAVRGVRRQADPTAGPEDDRLVAALSEAEDTHTNSR